MAVEVVSDVAEVVVSYKCKGLAVVRSTVEEAVEENLAEVVEGGHNTVVVEKSKQEGAGVMVMEVEASTQAGVVGVESKLAGVVKEVEAGESRLAEVAKEVGVVEEEVASILVVVVTVAEEVASILVAAVVVAVLQLVVVVVVK